MSYDAKVPLQLKNTQQWFGSIIGRPIDENNQMNPISPSGKLIEAEAVDYVAPSPTLRPDQRIQIYNQQYWWRLLNALHDAFPLITRILGYADFNRNIGIPYLTKYPPQHWSLSLLGDKLAQWIEEEYYADNKNLILNAVKMEWAFAHSFIAQQLSPLSMEQFVDDQQMEEMLNKILYAQPHLHLFEMEGDIFKFRIQYLAHPPEYWLEHELPKHEQSKKYFFIIFRNSSNDISWKEIQAGEFHLLSLFKNGATVDMACEHLEGISSEIYETSMAHIQEWFKEWTARGWLSLENPRKTVAL